MKIKNTALVSMCTCSIIFFATQGSANSEFQQWMQQQSQGVSAQKKEFQEYKDKRDKEFTAFLKSQWKPVDIVKGEVLDEAPKPDVMPVAEPPPAPTVTPATKPVVISVPQPAPVKQPETAPLGSRPQGTSSSILIFLAGRSVFIMMPH